MQGKSKHLVDLDNASQLELILSGIEGGRQMAVAYARQIALLRGDPRYKDLIADLDADKKADLGLLCLTHKIEPRDFWAALSKEAFDDAEGAMTLAKAQSQKIVAARLHKVVERGMIEGAKADGIADRHYTLQNEGFHVAPKGMSINVNQINQQAAGLASFEDETKELASILSSVESDHLLTEGETDYVEADVVSEIEAEPVPVKFYGDLRERHEVST